jgi:methylmalonyl-CoA mutase
VLCSTDETYPELAPVFARQVKAARPSLSVILAGHPGEREAEFRAAGFDDFIHIRSNVRTTLSQLQRLAGVLS